ncbi:hypothetical protein EVJ58_g2867 [Rhodofomes roseus]|uniref:Uncharacterized protein n=1 Tax=Rhodofomes roseus TaxID=34475 RepID=A0A4Y9YN84_9APHY|nr:hypothetical protein EVJ58_g2867 [Rhodofomes roseus]
MKSLLAQFVTALMGLIVASSRSHFKFIMAGRGVKGNMDIIKCSGLPCPCNLRGIREKYELQQHELKLEVEIQALERKKDNVYGLNHLQVRFKVENLKARGKANQNVCKKINELKTKALDGAKQHHDLATASDLCDRDQPAGLRPTDSDLCDCVRPV